MDYKKFRQAKAIEASNKKKLLKVNPKLDMGWRCLLGEYSTKAKALKVLDMIQEAYVNGHIDYQIPEDSEVVV